MSSVDILRLGAYLRNEYNNRPMTMITSEQYGTIFRILLPNNKMLEVCANTYVLPDIIEQPSDTMVGRIENWLRQHHPELNNWDWSGHLVLYGLVQSGKTEMIMSMIWIAQHVYKTTAVLVLANMVSSYNQVLRKNAIEFNDMLKSEFGNDSQHFLIKTPIGFRGRNIVDSDKDYTWLRVAMGNPAQLRRVMDDVRDKRYILFCDEADVHVKSCYEESDITATGPIIKELKKKANASVNITATPFALYNEAGVIQRTLVMQPSTNYRGVEETEWVFSSDQDAELVRKGDAIETVYMLDEMVMVQRPRVDNGVRKYMTILINGPHYIDDQNNLALTVAQMRPHWNVYVMNSKKRNGVPLTGNLDVIQQALSTGRMVDTDRCMISELYDMFEMDRNDSEFKIHIIVACLKASRAISFRPTTRSIGTGGLHGMLLFTNSTCHDAQLIQYMRPFGKYDPSYPPIRIRTTETIYDRIRIEITYNLKVFAEATATMGQSRNQIEGVSVMLAGKRKCLHDRPNVDDTIITDKRSMCKREFATKEELVQFLRPDYENRITTMTNQIITIHRSEIPNIQFGRFETDSPDEKRRKQTQMRQDLYQYVQQHIHEINGFQVCWTDQRYEDLHNMQRRFMETHNTNYMPMVVVGSGEENYTVIRAVEWKRQFYRHVDPSMDWTMDKFQPNRVYLYQTTKGTWRYYATQETRHIGVLGHRIKEE